ncbi:MAG: putative toxin-antitoxin system toxin component, PIN family [Gammaproteobacteria bacterium]
MRIVLDTNVLVSALINPHGPPAIIVANVLAERLIVVYDERILHEYRAVLVRPRFGFDSATVDTLLRSMEAGGEVVVPQPLALTLPDPDELAFIEVAEAALVAGLVTGNARDYVPISGQFRVPVYTPAAFVREIAAS